MGSYGLEELIMKKLIVLFSMSIFLTKMSHATVEHVTRLLQSEDWRERDKAINMLVKQFDQYKDNDLLKQNVLQVLLRENEEYKYLAKNKLRRGDEGRGEYYLDLVALVIRLDISGSIEALLDSAASGNAVEDAVVKCLMQEGEEDFNTFDSIKEKMTSPDIFYKGNRRSYLRIIQKYLQRKTGIHEKKKAIIKEIVLQGFFSKSHLEKKYAIQCSLYFPDDQQLMEQLQETARSDDYTVFNDGTKTFPVREEASNVLKKLQEQERK